MEVLSKETSSIFSNALGTEISKMPYVIQKFYNKGATWRGKGYFSVKWSSFYLIRHLAQIFQFPKPSNRIPFYLKVVVKENHQYWLRNFNGHYFSSRKDLLNQYIVDNRNGFQFYFILKSSSDGLEYIHIKTKFYLLKIPKWIITASVKLKALDSEQFFTSIKIYSPVLGTIAIMEGSLKPY
jgi:hypothetical protein